MRMMSFALTTAQVRARTKTVTRRLGWKTAKPGDVVQPIVKGQGLKKGEHVEKIGGPIRFVSITREMLSVLQFQKRRAKVEMAREGFPGLDPGEFIVMFAHANKLQSIDTLVTRIEFE